MSEIRCFWSVPIPIVQIELRRFVLAFGAAVPCPNGYHNASVVIGEKAKDVPPDRYEKTSEQVAHEDPRWPKKCTCGYAFTETDEWQTNEHRVYSGAGQAFILRDAPFGAMWDAWWMGEHAKGADGLHVCIKTPGGEWMPDGPSRNQDGTPGPSWTRGGQIPTITVRPSIELPGKYHAFLTDGILKSCE